MPFSLLWAVELASFYPATGPLATIPPFAPSLSFDKLRTIGGQGAFRKLSPNGSSRQAALRSSRNWASSVEPFSAEVDACASIVVVTASK